MKNLKFRYKLLVMPALAVTALLLLLIVFRYYSSQNARLLVEIEYNFVPALKVGAELTKALTDIQRGMKDAVAAQETEELELIDQQYQTFLTLLDQAEANAFFEKDNLTILRDEFKAYYKLAHDTARAMIEEDNLSEQTLAALNQMQTQYNAITSRVNAETRRAELSMSKFFAAALRNNQRSTWMMTGIIIACAVVLGAISMGLGQSLAHPLNQIIRVLNQFAEGQSNERIQISSADEFGELGSAFNEMAEKIYQQDWLKTGQTQLSTRLRGEQELSVLAQQTIAYIASYLNAQVGALYTVNAATQHLHLIGSYAFTSRRGNYNDIAPGEGLVGQAALEKQRLIFSDVPEDFLLITSGMGKTSPRYILVAPFLYEGAVTGVIEIGAVHEFTALELAFLDQVLESVAIAFHSVQSRHKMRELLEETQRQAEELQAQQEQLAHANKELEQKARSLQTSEEKLRAQQEELRQTNAELTRQSQALEQQQQVLQEKNRDLERTRQELEQKAEDLIMANQYKSEFLANMSHELRTPLNSMLILSKLLAENKEHTLTEKQVKSAETIYSAGSELLLLINDILDLSKVEAGKMIVNIEEMPLSGIGHYVRQHFQHQTNIKGLTLDIELQDGLPEFICTDRQRVEQILKNFLSNAIKFTAQGGIRVRIARPAADTLFRSHDLRPDNAIGIAVLDTGIGIPKAKQQLIFEAFQQADGTTSRKFGGTGLGLSISQKLAALLGGEVYVQSAEGQGSTFILYLPDVQTTCAERLAGDVSLQTMTTPTPQAVDAIRDDRHDLTPEDNILLIIEPDPAVAKRLFELGREKGFKCVLAGDGSAGLQLAFQHLPQAIMLDLNLPDMDGQIVMQRLQEHLETRPIPVHLIASRDKPLDAQIKGEIGCLVKPVTTEKLNDAFRRIESITSKHIKRLLIVEQDPVIRDNILTLLTGEDILITMTANTQEMIELLKTNEFDCLIIDLDFDDDSGFDAIDQIKTEIRSSYLPVIAFTGKELTRADELNLKQYVASIIIKDGRVLERLLDEVSLFLHRVESELPEAQQKALRMRYAQETILTGKTVLVVDDDMRNVFALMSVLEEQEMNVLAAENGMKCLEVLAAHREIDLVLMDIMMPDLDGYETMQKIRQQDQFHQLPIIALTAKAMKGDRQKCLDAGANDYLSKPIDTDKLLSLLRVWLYK